MNPFDVKKKALGAVKGYGREGIGEMLKSSYGKPSVSISVETMRPMAKHGGMSEEAEGEGELSPEMLAKHEGGESMGEMKKEGDYGMGEAEGEESSMGPPAEGKGESKITPELLEMLLAKLGK
jgi:hypothetical protein